jgi:Uma2 family endonuclease
MSAASPSHVSYEEYLVAEAASEDKHEWCDGVVYAMSRGTLEHARLTANLCRVLGNALGKGCTIFGPEAMLYVEAARLSTYADVTLVCGALETKVVRKAGRSLGEAVTNPTVVVEVLSESTERYDRDGKFQAYKQLVSMNEYVLVSQAEPCLEVYRRSTPDGGWARELAGPGERVTVHGAQVAVDDVYGS